MVDKSWKKNPAKIEIEKKHQNKSAISVDPDEMAHEPSHLHIHRLPQSARTSANSVEFSDCGGLSRMRLLLQCRNGLKGYNRVKCIITTSSNKKLINFDRELFVVLYNKCTLNHLCLMELPAILEWANSFRIDWLLDSNLQFHSRSVASDLVLRCLSMSHKKDARLIWINSANWMGLWLLPSKPFETFQTALLLS